MRRGLLAMLACLLMAVPAAAGPVVLVGSSAWAGWNAADVTGGPFWANSSYDRNGLANVGYYLAGVPGSDVPTFYAGSPGVYAPYLGDGATTWAWYGDRPAVTVLQGVTGWQDTWGVTEYQPFVWVFWLTNGEGQTWTSTTLDGGRSHFALFQGDGRYYLGIEDATWTTYRTADWDYNDAILAWPTEAVSDVGGTLVLFGLALVALHGVRRG